MYESTSIRLQAHKGDSVNAPENTMAAFRAACDAGYGFIELDPKFTADGVCVLHHDWTVNRTGHSADGTALPPDTRVDGLTLTELKALDFGVWFSEEFRGETIPAFEEAIPYILSRGVSVKVDNVWERFTPEQQETLFGLVRRVGACHPETGARIGMTCARLENVARVARELPEAAIHYDGFVDDTALAALDESAAGRELYIWLRFHNAKTAWNPNPPVDAAYAERVKAHGRLGIWLIDDPDEMPAVREFAPFVVETNGGVRPTNNDICYFTKSTEKLLTILQLLDVPKDDIIGIMMLCENNEEISNKVLGYVIFKEETNFGITCSDILSYTMSVRIHMGLDRIQFLPFCTYVRFIKESTEELYHGDFYYVNTIYGWDESSYLLVNELDEEKEYPAEDFERITPALIEYTGYEDENGNLCTEEGLEIGEQYRVTKIQNMYYILDNGRQCVDEEIWPVEFIPTPISPEKTISHDTALNYLKHAIEHGDVRVFSRCLTDQTELICDFDDSHLVGPNAIIKYFLEQHNYVLDHGLFRFVLKGKVEETGQSPFQAGEQILLIHEKNPNENGHFPFHANTEENGCFITKIIITNQLVQSLTPTQD